MPQAAPELQDLIIKRFGDLDISGPQAYLLDRGYSLSRGWTWSHPKIKHLKDMTRDEFDCLLFLVHEWDYGGLEES